MKVITGTVLSGKVALPPEALIDGTKVAILAPDTGAPVQLSSEQEAELEAAVEELDRGDFVSGTDLLHELRSKYQA